MTTGSESGLNQRPELAQCRHDSRDERLAQIQTRIENGTYKVDALQLSKSIIQKHVTPKQITQKRITQKQIVR